MIKTAFTGVAALAFATMTFGPAAAQPQRHTAQKSASRTLPFTPDATVQVNGLVCDFCAQAIDKSFRRQTAVANVHVDLTAKLVSLDFKPDATLDDAAIRRIVTNAGYTVVAIRRATS